MTPIPSADFNAQVIEEFRANAGHVGGRFEGMPLLLLHHAGARTGQNRRSRWGRTRSTSSPARRPAKSASGFSLRRPSGFRSSRSTKRRQRALSR